MAGKSVHLLTIVNQFTRESPWIEIKRCN